MHASWMVMLKCGSFDLPVVEACVRRGLESRVLTYQLHALDQALRTDIVRADSQHNLIFLTSSAVVRIIIVGRGYPAHIPPPSIAGTQCMLVILITKDDEDNILNYTKCSLCH